MPTREASQQQPWLAALFSAIVPGSGHYYAGATQLGIRLMLIDAVLLISVVVSVLFFQSGVLKAWASLSSLALIMVGNLILLAFRAWAAHDAYHYVSDRGSASNGSYTWLIGAAVWLILLAPHFALGYYDVVQYSLIDEVFADTPISADTSTTTVDGQMPPTDDPLTSPSTIRTNQPVIWDGLERLNILLLGTDVGTGRSRVRTDTMIVVSIDPATGDTAMISLPRNYSGITLPDGHGVWDCNCFPRLLNDLFFEAEEHPDWFPGDGEPGPRAIKAAIGNVLDLEIHYYALVTLDGFVGIVDALGGVELTVPNTIVDETYPHEDGVTIEHVVIEEGDQHLDGHLALAYARIRRHADDFARMNRQRCVLGAVMAQTNPLEMLTSYGAIAEVLKESLSTDIPQDRLVDFIDLLPVIDFDRVGVLHIDREYISGTADGRTYYDEARIKQETRSILEDPTSAYDGLNLENTCA